MVKRLFALIICICMCISLFPSNVFAEDELQNEPVQEGPVVKTDEVDDNKDGNDADGANDGNGGDNVDNANDGNGGSISVNPVDGVISVATYEEFAAAAAAEVDAYEIRITGNITIPREVAYPDPFYVPYYYSLSVAEGASLSVEGDLVIEDSLYIYGSCSMTKTGYIELYGTIHLEGGAVNMGEGYLWLNDPSCIFCNFNAYTGINDLKAKVPEAFWSEIYALEYDISGASISPADVIAMFNGAGFGCYHLYLLNDLTLTKNLTIPYNMTLFLGKEGQNVTLSAAEGVSIINDGCIFVNTGSCCTAPVTGNRMQYQNYVAVLDGYNNIETELAKNPTYIYVTGNVVLPEGYAITIPDSVEYIEICGDPEIGIASLTVNGTLNLNKNINIYGGLIVNGQFNLSGSAEEQAELEIGSTGFISGTGSISIANTSIALRGGAIGFNGAFNPDMYSVCQAMLMEYTDGDALLRAIPEGFRRFIQVYADCWDNSCYEALIDEFCELSGQSFNSMELIIESPWTISRSITIPAGLTMRVYANVGVMAEPETPITVTNNGQVIVYNNCSWNVPGAEASLYTNSITYTGNKIAPSFTNGTVCAEIPFKFSMDQGIFQNGYQLGICLYEGSEEPAEVSALLEEGTLCMDEEIYFGSKSEEPYSYTLSGLVPGKTYSCAGVLMDSGNSYYSDVIRFTVPWELWNNFTTLSIDNPASLSAKGDYSFSFATPATGIYCLNINGNADAKIFFPNGEAQEAFADSSSDGSGKVFFHATEDTAQAIIVKVNSVSDSVSVTVSGDLSQNATAVTKTEGKYAVKPDEGKVYYFTAPETGTWSFTVYQQGDENGMISFLSDALDASSRYGKFSYPDGDYDEYGDWVMNESCEYKIYLYTGETVCFKVTGFDLDYTAPDLVIRHGTEISFAGAIIPENFVLSIPVRFSISDEDAELGYKYGIAWSTENTGVADIAMNGWFELIEGNTEHYFNQSATVTLSCLTPGHTYYFTPVIVVNHGDYSEHFWGNLSGITVPDELWTDFNKLTLNTTYCVTDGSDTHRMQFIPDKTGPYLVTVECDAGSASGSVLDNNGYPLWTFSCDPKNTYTDLVYGYKDEPLAVLVSSSADCSGLKITVSSADEYVTSVKNGETIETTPGKYYALSVDAEGVWECDAYSMDGSEGNIKVLYATEDGMFLDEAEYPGYKAYEAKAGDTIYFRFEPYESDEYPVVTFGRHSIINDIHYSPNYDYDEETEIRYDWYGFHRVTNEFYMFDFETAGASLSHSDAIPLTDSYFSVDYTEKDNPLIIGSGEAEGTVTVSDKNGSINATVYSVNIYDGCVKVNTGLEAVRVDQGNVTVNAKVSQIYIYDDAAEIATGENGSAEFVIFDPSHNGAPGVEGNVRIIENVPANTVISKDGGLCLPSCSEDGCIPVLLPSHQSVVNAIAPKGRKAFITIDEYALAKDASDEGISKDIQDAVIASAAVDEGYGAAVIGALKVSAYSYALGEYGYCDENTLEPIADYGDNSIEFRVDASPFIGSGSGSKLKVFREEEDGQGKASYVEVPVTADMQTGMYTVTADASSKYYLVKIAKEITVTVSSKAGEATSIATLSGGGKYLADDQVTVTAPDAEGYRFVGWYNSDERVCKDNEYTFTAGNENISLTAVYQPEAMLRLKISGSGFSVNGVTQYGPFDQQFPAGTEITIAFSGDESDFIRWKNDMGSLESTSAVYTFNLVSSKNLECVSRSSSIPQSSAYVEFLSAYNQVMACGTWNGSDALNQHTLPGGVSKSGYTFGGWQIGNGGTAVTVESLLNYVASGSESYVALKPILMATGRECNISLIYDGGEAETEKGVEGRGYTFTAPDIEGRTFSHWEDGKGQKLSTKKSYWLKLTNDITLNAVYVDAGQTVKSEPVYAITSVAAYEEGGNDKLRFMMIRSIPEEYELIAYGYIRSINDDYSTKETLKLIEGSTPSGYFVRTVDNDPLLNGSYEYVQSIGTGNRDKNLYVRGFLKVIIEGEESIVYTDVASVSYNGIAG